METITKTEYTQKQMVINYAKNGNESVVYYLSDGKRYKKISPMQYNKSILEDVTNENASVYDLLILNLRNKVMFKEVIKWNAELLKLKDQDVTVSKKEKYNMFYDIVNK
jgi:hypothetical protein